MVNMGIAHKYKKKNEMICPNCYRIKVGGGKKKAIRCESCNVDMVGIIKFERKYGKIRQVRG